MKHARPNSKSESENKEADKVRREEFQKIRWGVLRFIPNTITGEFLNIGIVIHGETGQVRVLLGEYVTRIMANARCCLTEDQIEAAVKDFLGCLQKSGERAETTRIFQELTTSLVRAGGEQEWERVILRELVPL